MGEQPENCLCKKLGTEKISSNIGFYIFFRVCFTFSGTAHVIYPTIIDELSVRALEAVADKDIC